MKASLTAALALALLTGGALAQDAAPPPAPAGMTPPTPSAAPPPARTGAPALPPGGPAAFDGGGPEAAPPEGGRGRHPPPPPPKGAHIHLQHGDTMLDVKCADDQPMGACADLTLQMLDRLQVMKN